MDEDVQILDVNEPERKIDEFEDGVGKKKRKLEHTSLLKFTRYVWLLRTAHAFYLITSFNTSVL